MTNRTLQPFHLAIPVNDLCAARHFYGEVIGCSEGRSSDKWIDWNFYGHQLVTHKASPLRSETNPVDGHDVPAFHFGMVLPFEDWEMLAEHCKKQDVPFVIEPNIRFKGEVGEQGTFFVRDPAGNVLEFKTLKDLDQLFASD